jgi:hypothetical protein
MDGTAWIVAPQAGEYRLIYDGGSQAIHVEAQELPAKPGCDYVQRLAQISAALTHNAAC